MQMYVNYYGRYERIEGENPTVGILLCKKSDEVLVDLTLPEEYFESKEQEENRMQEAVLKLKEIGAPPEGFEGSGDFPSDEILDVWDAYQDAVESIRMPVTWEEAKILIRCCPTDRMAGIEWSLLHSIESCISKDALLKTPDGAEKYKNLIRTCNSQMMRGMLSERLESFLSSKNKNQPIGNEGVE